MSRQMLKGRVGGARLLMLVAVLGLAFAAPGSAQTTVLTPVGETPPTGTGYWLSGPDANTPVLGSSGSALVNSNGTTVQVKATGLVPGHAYTMWLVYFNDGTTCTAGESGPPLTSCGFADLFIQGGVTYGDGKVVSESGKATFVSRLNVGYENPSSTPPPPWGSADYEPVNPDYHVVIRSHGPANPGQIGDQITSFFGGCVINVGPPPGQSGPEWPIPEDLGECGDVQLYLFETVPATP